MPYPSAPSTGQRAALCNDGPKVERSTGQIPSELATLSDRITAMTELVERLQTRVAPICRPVPANDVKPQPCPPPEVVCEIAGHLRDFSKRIEYLRVRLVETLETIEL
jgi:hypothetical protein